jgi:hypothetical protein
MYEGSGLSHGGNGGIGIDFLVSVGCEVLYEFFFNFKQGNLFFFCFFFESENGLPYGGN